MGCCISTNRASEDDEQAAPPKHRHFQEGFTSKSPPPSLLEEETVKEVLSETPALKPVPVLKIEEEQSKANKPVVPEMERENEVKETPLPKIEEGKMKKEKIEKKDPVNVTEEISEVSEICSLSESISTTTITERREDDERSRDDGEVRQRVDRSPAKVPRHRSFTGDYAGRTQRGGKSPARRPEPSSSPRRNDNGLKSSVHGTEVRQTTRRRISGTNGPRRDSGESSGRRSRSPATRTESGCGVPRGNLGRSPSSRKTGRSRSQVLEPATENSRKLEDTKEANCPPSNESLENPLVSLECFIFL